MNGWIKCGAAMAFALVAGVAMAQGVPAPAAAASTQLPVASSAVSSPQMTRADLAAFFDGLVPFAMRRSDIAGGVVVVVRDGKVLFASGYGYANVADQTPVSPKTTLFRIGSISKLFTWTAVMQLVQQETGRASGRGR